MFTSIFHYQNEIEYYNTIRYKRNHFASDLNEIGRYTSKIRSTFYLAALHVQGTEVVLATAVPMRYQRKIYVPLSVQV